jgi:hypothetical protein
MSDNGRPTRAGSHRGAWLLLAAVMTAVIAADTALLVVPAIAAQDEDHQRSWHGAITAVEIDGGSAGVTLRSGRSGQAQVTEHLHWTYRKPRVEQTLEGGVLRLSVHCDDVPVPGASCDVNLDLRIPRDAAVRVDVSSGAVEARDLAGDLSVRLDTGPIDGYGLLATHVEARTVSGPIDLTFADAPKDVSATAVDGPVDVSVPQGSHYAVTATSTVGGASVDDGLDSPGATARITAKAVNGPVDVSWH